jgi:hypothetical protein
LGLLGKFGNLRGLGNLGINAYSMVGEIMVNWEIKENWEN